jgi:hypothetical protein
MSGSAELLEGSVSAHSSPDYLEKYRERIIRISGSPEDFAEAYPVRLRVRLTRVRGF